MNQRLIYLLLLLIFIIGACEENKNESADEKQIYYQEIDEVISISGQYKLDIDGDSIDDYYLRLFHANYNEPIFITFDTFYIEFGSLSDGYYYYDKGVDCVPCYEYYEPYETWTGASSPNKTSSIISSYDMETGIEGKEEAYLWLEKHEKSGVNDYYYNVWLRIKVSENRDTVSVIDCALGLDKDKTLRIGEKHTTLCKIHCKTL